MGCGNGANLRWLSASSDRLWASDYNPQGLPRAISIGATTDEVFLADLTDYPAIDGAFDLIFLNHVLDQQGLQSKRHSPACRSSPTTGVATRHPSSSAATSDWSTVALRRTAKRSPSSSPTTASASALVAPR